MPINKRFRLKNLPVRARLLALAPLTSLLLTTPLLHAADPGNLAAKELAHRGQRVTDARNLLVSGDEAYQAGKWKEAVEAYSKARDLLPSSPVTAELRDAATERLALGSIEYAKDLSRLGDVAGAKAVMDGVLADGVAPHHAGALAMRAKLDDPIRTNPALTKEHTADVEEVRLLLYKAEGAYNLGKFDEAQTVYQDVLRTDPYNTAARRGMEQVSQAKMNYTHAANDETRAEMLAQVDAAWELKVNSEAAVPEMVIGRQSDAGQVLLSKKLKGIILPIIDLDDVSLEEAVDFLRAQANRLDTFSTDPKDKGVNFVIALGPADSEAAKAIQSQKIHLQMRNVPLEEALKHINEATRTAYSIQDFALTIRPAGTATGEVISRTFQVPPDFLSLAGSAGGSTDAAAPDPFAKDSAKSEGLLAKRLTALEVLKNQGIPFPDGTSASFNSGTSTLRVANTTENLMLVDDLLASLSHDAPATVLVEVKIIRTKEVRTQELGWDWFLGEFSLGGGGVDNTLLTGGSADESITSGNRSGNFAISGNSLDSLLLAGSAGFSPPQSRAASPLRVFGLLNNANFEAVMRGVNQRKDVSLAACPSVAVRSGQAAKIEVGRELIYPTEYEPPQLPNTVNPQIIVDPTTGLVTGTGSAPNPPVTPSHPTSFTKRSVGITLEVLPTASADHNTVDLSVKPNVTDFDGFVNFGTPITSSQPNTITGLGNDTIVLTPNEILMPVFSVLKTDTNLTVANGATIVLGGMLQEKVQKVEDHTPILGDLPLVGRFFHEDAYSPERTAVVIMVTVHVVDPAGRSFSNN